MSGLDQDPFDWFVTADDRVVIRRGGRQVAVRGGVSGRALAAQLRAADEQAAQQILARATGNYKRGNERRRLPKDGRGRGR